MTIQKVKISKIFGKEIIDPKAIEQLENCLIEGSIGVLTADAHVGYGHPIGGAIAYKNHISLSGVGFDIGCGNKAVKTNIKLSEISKDIPKIADEIMRRVSFGMGRPNNEPIKDDLIFDLIADSPVKEQRDLLQLAKDQLGTVGSGK